MHLPSLHPIFRRVSITRLLSILAVLALIAAPVAMLGGGTAMAASAPQSVAAADHCSGMQGDHDRQQSGASHDCVMACSAIAPAAEPAAEKALSGRLVHHPLPRVAFEGVDTPAETPPPRFS